MDDKKKILLGSKDVISKDNEDLFINVNLNQTFSEIRDDKFENVFDISNQFNKERNASRDFRIYGIIDATIADCDNLILSAFTSSYSGTGINSGVTYLSGYVKSFSSSTLVYNGFNAYGKKRGKYLLELTGYTNDFIYITIPSNNLNFNNQFYSQQLIFRDAEGIFIDYGTQTIEITDTGNAINISNDFYFLYNKHWIKKDLLIIEEKPAVISFSATPDVTIINEIPLSVLFSGGAGLAPYLSPFAVTLNKPSPFGLENSKINILSSTLNPTTEIALVDEFGSFITLPYSLTFNVGEQQKLFYAFSPLDYEQEFLENIIFELKDFLFVSTGSPLTHTIEVIDGDERNRVTLNFQNIFSNRNYFTGIKKPISSVWYSYPMPAVLRNGLKFEGTPMEFYPIDNYSLKITNIGVNTILPINPSLSIVSEQVFIANSSMEFNINEQYLNTEKHTIKFNFAQKTASSIVSSIPAALSGFTINSIPIIDYWLGNPYKFDYDTIVSALKNIPNTLGINISGWYRYNLDIPFDVFEDITNLSVTLIAKNPGTRLDLKTFGFLDGEYIFENSQIPGLFSAQTIQNFVYSAQTPLEIVLGANTNNNTEAQYAFTILKNGFDSLSFTSSTLTATLSAPKYYLASSYHDILRNWNDITNQPVYVHSGVTSNWTTAASNGSYNSGEVYVNGVLLLSNKYFDTTQNTASFVVGTDFLNQSHFSNQSGDFRADFLPSPISTIPQTFEYFSPQDRAQKGYLAIRAYGTSLPSGATSFRSFDFRTGSTSTFTTFATNQFSKSGLEFWPGAGAGFSASGGIISPLQHSLQGFLKLGISGIGNTPQGLNGYNPVSIAEYDFIYKSYNVFYSVADLIELESLTPGVPFEITNVVDMMTSTGSLLINTGSIKYFAFLPNEILGITINEANNWLGGFSLTHP